MGIKWKSFRWIFSIIIPVMAVGFMVLMISMQWDKIANLEWTVKPWILVSSQVGAILVLFMNAFGWHLILLALGEQIPLRKSLWIWSRSSFARYIPGGVWSYANRAVLVNHEGVVLGPATASLYYETILACSASLTVGFTGLFTSKNATISPIVPIIGGIITSLLLHPKVIGLATFLPGRIGLIMGTLPKIEFKIILALYLYYIIFWIILGASFVAFVSAFYTLHQDHWIYVGTSFALAFFAGFIVMAAPGGIGVRESSLYFLLLPILSPILCLVVSSASRLWLMVAELVSAILSYTIVCMGRWYHYPESKANEIQQRSTDN